jgi:DNA recombination protein RmuC
VGTETLPWAIAAGALLLAAALALWLTRAARTSFANAERAVRDELRSGRAEASASARELREEVSGGFRQSAELIAHTLSGVAGQIKELQQGNERKLDEMRALVDERLQKTLEQRLGESFKLVSAQLEAVHRGLGDMQTLAVGVGDLKRVFANVKTRGTFGEIQLGAILEQVLTPDQYGRNVRPRPESRETVEFAVRLPGPDASRERPCWLPIDAKFPHEDYGRLVVAQEAADTEAIAVASAALARAVRTAAQSIRDKYVSPPHTTDFAILFVPTESLYAELLRQPGLVEALQQDQRVLIAGPTTLAALLNSLRLGFRTLAIEQRASEVWKVLASVKTEFAKFGDVLERVKRQLQTASNTIDETGVRTRAISKHLRDVEELPLGAPPELFELTPPEAEEE